MNCPICNVPLVQATRLGSMVSLCPNCRGEWVPQGEIVRPNVPPSPGKATKPEPAPSGASDSTDETRCDLFNWF